MISVVINNYNYGRFLSECIESVLNQTEAALEVIVVDDGSTDDSAERIGAFGDRIVSVFQDNAGQAAAMNAGFALSRGDWILFLDADDYLLPGAISELKSELKAPFTRVQFPLEQRDDSGRRMGLIPPHLEELTSGNALQHFRRTGVHSTPPTSGNAFLRQWLETVMPIPRQDYRLCADLYLSFSALATQEIDTLPAPLGVYRVHHENSFYQESIFSLRLEHAPRKLRAMRQMIELLLGQHVADDIDSFEMYADRFLNLRQLKEILLAQRLLGSRSDLPLSLHSTRRAIRRIIDSIEAPMMRWREHLNLLLVRFFPLDLWPLLARIESFRKRLRQRSAR